MSSGSSVWGWLLFLGQTAKKKMLRNSTVLCFLWVHFSFFLSYSWKKKEEAPKRFSSSLCIFYSISPSSFFLLWSRSCRDSSLCILFSSVVVVLFLGRFCRCHPDEWHTHTTTGTQFMWDFSHLLFLLLSLISHWRNPISILIWTPWDISRKKKFGLEQKPQSLEREGKKRKKTRPQMVWRNCYFRPKLISEKWERENQKE